MQIYEQAELSITDADIEKIIENIIQEFAVSYVNMPNNFVKQNKYETEPCTNVEKTQPKFPRNNQETQPTI